MADIPFQIGGHLVRCPNWKNSKFDPAALEYQYLNGSLVYIGGSLLTMAWDFLPDDEVATLRTVYNDFVTGVDPVAGTGSPISLTIPDRLAGGLRTTTAYPLEPTGAAGGDGTRGFSMTFYNLHEATLLAAMASPQGNLWDVVNNGGNIEIGNSSFLATS
jgi:hypothetical protein